MEGIILLTIIAFATVPTTTAQYMNLSPTRPNNNEANNRLFQRFDVELLKTIATKNTQNILVSPFSIKQVLAMVLEGAGGSCADELRQALRLNANSKVQVREQFSNLIGQFKRDISNVFKIANRIFLTDKQKPNKAFKKILEQYYNASVELCNFVDSYQTARNINDWVKDETEGLIPSIIEQNSIGPQTSIILTNALYFKGIWETEFNTKNTHVKCFKHPDNNCFVHTYMMDISNTYNYYKSRELDAQVIEMPYRGNTYSMVIFLPNKIDGITKILKDLPYDYHSTINNLEMTDVIATIPRFKIEYSDDMLRTLEELDIKKIFSETTANLSGIIEDNDNLFVSNVFHKAVIEVNEKGTIAAAATGAVVVPLIGDGKPIFTADHPFIFFIRHVESGTILFAGHVLQPTIAKESDSSRVSQRYKQEYESHMKNDQIVFVQQNSDNTEIHNEQIPQQPNIRRVEEPIISNDQNTRVQNSGSSFRTVTEYVAPFQYQENRQQNIPNTYDNTQQTVNRQRPLYPQSRY